ncbi:MAG: hypothetical protein RJB66_266 [Pseudomonadota bacterium]|jgi:hypothetical protein
MKYAMILVLSLIGFNALAAGGQKASHAYERQGKYKQNRFIPVHHTAQRGVIPLPEKRTLASAAARPAYLYQRPFVKKQAKATRLKVKKVKADEEAVDRVLAALGGYEANHLAAADSVNMAEMDSLAVQDVSDGAVIQVRTDRSKVVSKEPVMKTNH